MITQDMIKDAVYELYKKAVIVLGNDVKKALEDALKVEDNELARLNIEAILKNIELHNRQNWDFVQTIGCNVIGECPANVIETVKKMFDAGVTLWHNGTFNYGTLDNPIITTS